MKSSGYVYARRMFLACCCAMLLCMSGIKAQLSVEPIVEMLCTRDGEECIYTNSEGQRLAIETVGEMILKAAMSMKSSTIKPWTVTNGVRQEMRIFDPLPITQKKNTEGIDFTVPNLVFLREDKSKLSAAEAKTMLEADNTLLAEMYNGKNGIVSEYIRTFANLTGKGSRPNVINLSYIANKTIVLEHFMVQKKHQPSCLKYSQC